MKYAELKDLMTEFRLGHITRSEMVAAFALWQRPVTVAKEFETKQALAIAFNIPLKNLFFSVTDHGKNARQAIEAVIR